MLTKECPARIKAAGTADGLAEGQFVALVSVFGNIDSVGDVVVPGAFADDLARWVAKGDPIPVIWSHDWRDPFSHIGTVLEAEETVDGLVVKAQIEDLDTNAKAAQVYRLLKGRRVTQFSFAYDIDEGAWVDAKEGRSYYELRKLRLHEVGPCLVGANQETELLAAKAATLAEAVKGGRTLADAHYERLARARDAITGVLDARPTKTPARDAGQPPAADNDDAARAPKSSSADRPQSRTAQAAARLTLMTITDGDS
ncbi:HK97 family phage prohead protease [Microtetraspora niveoalba]|uniref:HK97 family phage prohead protease n=1 Tax=Microtetraspora niveoalba TaxID=46175 RepID=UPI0008377078|nr:HK97 family phage prohead protease [Microtetraspora niveoalba]